MTKICEYCHKEYDAERVTRRYCSGRCRTAAFREKQQGARKKAVRAYKARTQQEHKVYSGINESDPRSRLVKMRARGLLTPEYWTLYQEVDKQFYGGSGVVNGVSTQSPHFVEAVLFQIIEDGRIYAWVSKEKNGNGE